MKTKEIAAYVRNNVEFFEERLQMALNKMDRMRCPFIKFKMNVIVKHYKWS